MGCARQALHRETTYDIVRWYRMLRTTTRADEGEHWKLLAGWLAINKIEIPSVDRVPENQSVGDQAIFRETKIYSQDS